MESSQRTSAPKKSRRKADRSVDAAAKKSTRVRRGRAVLARPTEEPRARTRIQSIRALGASAGREVGALIAIAVGALFLLSLLSFHPRDALIGQWGQSSEPVRNWIGPIGAQLADWAVAGLGATAFAMPLLLLMLGAAIVLKPTAVRRWLRVLGFGLVLGTLALLAQIAFPSVPFRGASIAGGGAVGQLLQALLVPNVSTVGTVIVATTGLLAGARLGFGVRFVALARSLGRGAARGSEPIVGAAGAGLSGAGRGARGLLGAGGAWVRRVLGELRESREVAREERRFRREERLAALEEKRLIAEQTPPPATTAPALDPDPEPERAPSSVSSALILPPKSTTRQSPPSRVRIPEAMRAPTAPSPPVAPPLIAEDPVVPIPTAALPALADLDSVQATAPVDDPPRVDSMRGATSRGVVHAEIRPKRAKRPTNVAPPEVDAPVPSPVAEERPTDSRPAIHRPKPTNPHESVPSPREARQALIGKRLIHRPGKERPPFELPALSLLSSPPAGARDIDEDELERQAARLEETLGHYNVKGRVTDILPGPVVTMFEFEPAPGIKVSRIANLENDLAMALRATRVRIVAPIPGKGAVGIEIPSAEREIIYLREILASSTFRNPKLRLPLAIGKAIDAQPVCADWAKMPHVLVAGTTGSGKSVCVNSFIISLVCSRTPDELRMILVDPKMLEFSIYDGIPHLLVPVVTSPKKAAVALRWAVEEMTRRYKVLAAMNTRNIIGYNEKVEGLAKDWKVWDDAVAAGKAIGMEPPDCGRELGSDSVCFRSRGGHPVAAPEKMPYIVIIIDELADLMMVARKEVEESIVRLAQMARAAGIHMLLATQRPSVDVITGLIKANFPTRLSFKVSSKVDSRTVLDGNGAQNLLGMGDGLFLPPGSSDLKRIHGAFVSDDEVERIVAHLKEQGEPQYVEQVLAGGEEDEDGGPDAQEELDEMYDAAVACVAQMGKASTSLLQRKLGLGYNRAARIMDAMEANGVIGPPNGAKPRDVYAQPL